MSPWNKINFRAVLSKSQINISHSHSMPPFQPSFHEVNVINKFSINRNTPKDSFLEMKVPGNFQKFLENCEVIIAGFR